ncbi:glycosyl hydrolase catalytic core-domain-containing protein [Tuber borchii]|uniref:Glycosyl hydrolase catalytic core-domain-containing protein n=1 Tax=Tuber borchii TaxID=42251 RepID=A0A2T6ZSA7_TUBBO|nr:glycosyl hydrolase catalytic core-domain-containing protein [Tuber borchii]
MFLLLLLLLLTPIIAQTTSSKRGLVHIASGGHPSDDSIWITPPTTLTWYYNYNSRPTSSLSSGNLSFVPMLWGDHNNTFVEDVRGQEDVKWVLSFNEPDMGSNVGGSDITPVRAAELWKRDIEPLKGVGKELGAPAVSGSSTGMSWLKDFFNECDGCSVDFIPIHWYGNFEGLASHIGEVRAAFPNKTIWVTEFGWADQPLAPTQNFFNTTLKYLDRLDYVTHYSWFGSFRSDVSNVGPNGAMLNSDGEVTDIGAWYLGRQGKGIKPNTGNSAARIRRGDWVLWGIVYFIISLRAL